MDSEVVRAAEDFLKSGGVEGEPKLFVGIVTTMDTQLRLACIVGPTIEFIIGERDRQMPGLPLFIRVA